MLTGQNTHGLGGVLGALLAIVHGANLPACADSIADSPDEARTKSVMICSFVRHAVWPRRKFPRNDAPVVIGILGDETLSTFLGEAVRSRTSKGRPIVVRNISLTQEVGDCHAVFVSRRAAAQAGEVLRIARRGSVMTIGETPGFIKSGGVIEFSKQGARVCFHVSRGALRRERLKVSGWVLNAASRREFPAAAAAPLADARPDGGPDSDPSQIAESP